jgi:hypothetical protein
VTAVIEHVDPDSSAAVVGWNATRRALSDIKPGFPAVLSYN